MARSLALSLAALAAAPLFAIAGPPSPPINGGVDILPGRYLQSRQRDEGLIGFYPAEALRRGVSGKVTLDCKVAQDGIVHSCSVKSETPAGQGFGEASLRAVATFRFSAASTPGDVRVLIPFAWDAKWATAYVVKPLWVQRPRRADLEATAPALVADRLSGSRLDCLVKADGGLTDCRVDWATSPEDVVGPAAIKVANTAMRIAPEDGFGMSTAGRRVRVDVSFPQTVGKPPPPLLIAPPPLVERDSRLPYASPPQRGATGVPGSMPPPPPPSTVVKAPDWVHLPDGDTLAAAYPKAAFEQGIDGRSTIACRVLADGTLTACTVISEDPEGAGFGEATMSVAKYFQMKPMTRNGQPVEGGIVRIPMVWRLPE